MLGSKILSNDLSDNMTSQQSLNPVAVVIFDIDGVVRDVAGSYRRAIADTVEHFTQSQYRPTPEDIDTLKAEGCWNNDWEASRELIQRFQQTQRPDSLEKILIDFQAIIDFFQGKYRGDNFSGYIQSEPLLMSKPYLEELTQAKVYWGFFSGATRGSANYVLEQRLGLHQPILIAMEDAPSKPDPTGLFQALELLSHRYNLRSDSAVDVECPILYVGDTVADMHTITKAKQIYPAQQWFAIGVIPPHVQNRSQYAQMLQQHGADLTLDNVQSLNSALIFHQFLSQPA
jgi:HAD superfamily phosphatase